MACRSIGPAQKETERRRHSRIGPFVCFLPMMAIFFGIVDVCFAVSIQSLFSQATRAGSRFAITYSGNYNGSTCSASQSACIANVVQDNAVGFLAGNRK